MEKEKLSPVEQTAIRASEIFKKLPLAYKRLIMFADWLMVLDGMKAATDYAFLGNTWDENEFQIFKQTLESAGIKVSDVHTRYFKDNIPFRSGHIYNPRALAAQTAHSEMIPPFDVSSTFDEYEHMLKESGVPDGIIYGKLYSFPESAIKDYLKGSGHELTDTNRVGLGQGNESYWAYSPLQDDVIEREKASEIFLSKIEQNPLMKRIYESEELKASDKEWSRRLSKLTKQTLIQRLGTKLRSLRR